MNEEATLLGKHGGKTEIRSKDTRRKRKIIDIARGVKKEKKMECRGSE